MLLVAIQPPLAIAIMETEVYQIAPKNGTNIQELAKDGELLALREKLELPALELQNPNAEFFRFRKMTEDESNVFKVLFPVETEVEKYKEFLPLEVLQALEEFKATCPHRMVKPAMVWHAKDYDPDPILSIAVRTEYDKYEFPDAVYLIARWGEALLPMEQLERMAFQKWKAKRLTDLRRITREVASLLLDTQEAECVTTVSNPYFSA